MAIKGYSTEISEKMERLCDLLESIESSEFLSNRLSLYGGTAMNFIYLDRPRLSEDLDYNYRHIDEEDWGKVRDKIDERLKFVIRSLDYEDDQLKINPKHNQCRFHIHYTSDQGIKNDIKIEIGYMRRYPDMKEDTFRSLKHLTENRKIKVMTPRKEELFANKFATMVSRSKTYLNPRDLFDVRSISMEEFNYRLFLELVTLETILMDMKYSDLDQIIGRLKHGDISGRIEHMVKGEINFDEMIQDVISFSRGILDDMTSKDLDQLIDIFYSTGVLELKGFKFKKELHPKLSEHPQLRWLRKNR